MKQNPIECIIEESSEPQSMELKVEGIDEEDMESYDDSANSNNNNGMNGDWRNQQNGSQNDSSNALNKKITMPVVRMYHGKKYVVGMCSRGQSADLSQVGGGAANECEEDEKPVHYYPPKLLIVNFPRPHNYDAQTQLLLLENAQFEQRLNEMNQTLDLTSHLEQVIVGSALSYAEKQAMREFWFTSFFAFALRYPPCCKRVKKFWEWVFMLNPKSNFQWRFKTYSVQWIELMTSYIEFRETLAFWLDTFEDAVVDSSEFVESKQEFQAHLYAKYLRELLVAKNKTCYAQEDVELRPDMEHQVMNNGVVIKPEGYKETCICKRQERERRIGTQQKLNKVAIKADMKMFLKNREVISLFKVKEVTQQQIDAPIEQQEEDDEEDDDDDDDVDDDDQEDDEDDIDEEEDQEQNENDEDIEEGAPSDDDDIDDAEERGSQDEGQEVAKRSEEQVTSAKEKRSGDATGKGDKDVAGVHIEEQKDETKNVTQADAKKSETQ